MVASPHDPALPLSDSRFCFHCGPEVSCFTACCARLNLKLMPYDIVRLARRLEMSTTDFLERHTTAVENVGQLPRVALLMREDDQRCPFVTEQGCSVYQDRPAACRTYPLARAASPGINGDRVQEAYFIIREDHCQGFREGREWTVEEWVADQDLATSLELNDLWMKVLARQQTVLSSSDSERKVRMFNLASYDLDQFRRFVFEGGLLDRLDLSPRIVESLRTDDLRLLRFAVAWLRLALLGEMSSALARP